MARTKGAKDKTPRKPRGSDGPRVLPGDGGPPAPGHNSGDLTEEQKQALFLRHLPLIQNKKADIARATGELGNLYKQARADGYSKKDFDYADELGKQDDKVMIERRRREQQIARWLEHPIGTQPDMFDEPDRAPVEERAYSKGKVAGMKGEGCAPPYDQSTPQGQRWIAGWHDGLTIGRSLFQAKKPETPAAPPPQEAFEDAMPDEHSDEGDEVVAGAEEEDEAAGATTH